MWIKQKTQQTFFFKVNVNYLEWLPGEVHVVNMFKKYILKDAVACWN